MLSPHSNKRNGLLTIRSVVHASLTLTLLLLPRAALSDVIPWDADVSGMVSVACGLGLDGSFRGGGSLAKVASGEKRLSNTCPDGRSGTGFASADARTRGTLHAFAQASGNLGSGGEATFADARANATFANLIDFMDLGHGSANGVVVFGMRVDGSLSGLATGEGCISIIEFNVFQCHGVEADIRGGQGQTSFVVTVPRAISLPHTPILVVESLDVTAGAEIPFFTSEADFGRTAQAFLELPPGWTFTSASGDFLAGSTVPEPGTFSLLGLALIGCLAAEGFRRHAPHGAGGRVGSNMGLSQNKVYF